MILTQNLWSVKLFANLWYNINLFILFYGQINETEKMDDSRGKR